MIGVPYLLDGNTRNLDGLYTIHYEVEGVELTRVAVELLKLSANRITPLTAASSATNWGEKCH